MSTKTTLLLTIANEHWYKEGNGPYYAQSKTDEPFVLEFDVCHKIETDEDGTTIVIEEGTPLYNKLHQIFYGT